MHHGSLQQITRQTFAVVSQEFPEGHTQQFLQGMTNDEVIQRVIRRRKRVGYLVTPLVLHCA